MPIVYDDQQPTEAATPPSPAIVYDDGGPAEVPTPPTSGPGPVNRFLTAADPVHVAQSIYNDPSGALQTADDAVRAAANAMTFGMADRFAGAMNRLTGRTGASDQSSATDEEVARSGAARERSPYASIVGDVGGSLALPGFGAEALSAKLGGRMLGRAAGYGLTGAGIGAAQGAGGTYSGDPQDYVRNALVGGALGGALGGFGGSVFGRGPARAEVPDSSQLWQSKAARYRDLTASGATYDATHLAQTANDVENDLLTGTGRSPYSRFHWRDSPSTWDALDEMRQPAAAIGTGNPPVVGATVDPAGIDFIRKGITGIPQSAERATDRTSGAIVNRALDDFLTNPPPGAVRPGTEAEAQVAAGLAADARDENSAYRRVQRMEELYDNAVGAAGTHASGLNIENKLRQSLEQFTKEKRGVSDAIKEGFVPDEIDQLRNFARTGGTRLGNIIRWGGNTLGGGSGLGALAALGVAGGAAEHYYGGDDEGHSVLHSLALPAAGLGLRLLGNRLAMNNMRGLQDMVAMRSPLYRDRVAAGLPPGPGMPGVAKTSRDAIALALMRNLNPPQSPQQ